jgi:2-keto-3-deoxy-L-rhamnonate aldolase RhmA
MRPHPFYERRQAKKRPLITLTVTGFDPAFIEIVAQFGIDVIWIEMEHASVTFREAENLCRIVQGCGMLAMIRLPNFQREAVLKAAETGADMLMAPMMNDRADLELFVKNARYAPEGERGFYGSSRGLNYGLGAHVSKLREQANDRLLLWAQVETLAALERIEELSQVPGIDGIFIGPGDLSAAYGVPGEPTDARIAAAIQQGATTARRHNKVSASVIPAGDLAKWQDSLDMISVGGNIGFYTSAAKMLHETLQKQGITLPLGKHPQ